MSSQLFSIAVASAILAQPSVEAQPRSNSIVGIESRDHQIVITVDAAPVATYVFADEKIPRPYFAHVRAPSGIQVTRRHPPIEGKDRTDHDTMHPGIWLAFGDLDGEDFWRNKSRVVHRKFLQKPVGGEGKGSFVEEKFYRKRDGGSVCSERFRCTFHVRPTGYLIEWDSTFESDRDFFFGDQEEMGLGIRVATPIMGIKDGRLLDSEGRVGEKQVWGNAARWCDYAGPVDGKHTGMTLLAHPDNFRPSWLHARDYGFVAMNPFGRQAMKKGPRSKVVVKAGESLRLRYGVLLHSSDERPDLARAYEDYVRLAR
jgi:hypothetical protein